ncbi:hypothetical protein [Nocardia brasiliensis]|uniref:hypothetical protein n=1 Tax=Nocardia brasiliensis TaxID=37326 RepID=UPI00114CEC86|nr:hypothetical protein [Nocardia brasiliensis]
MPSRDYIGLSGAVSAVIGGGALVLGIFIVQQPDRAEADLELQVRSSRGTAEVRVDQVEWGEELCKRMPDKGISVGRLSHLGVAAGSVQQAVLESVVGADGDARVVRCAVR